MEPSKLLIFGFLTGIGASFMGYINTSSALETLQHDGMFPATALFGVITADIIHSLQLSK